MPGKASTNPAPPMQSADERVASLRTALALVDPASAAAEAYRAAIARIEANAATEDRAVALAAKYRPPVR